MTEWWTYRPSDFLMFAPRIYWRLFESVNDAWGPLPSMFCALVLAGALVAAAGPRSASRWRRGSDAVVAAMLGVSAWVFLHQRFAPIFWVAEGWAWAFALQALLLLMLSLTVGPSVANRAGGARAADADANASASARAARARVAVVLAVWAALGHPLLALAAGRPWAQAEWVGLAPDPTAIVVLAWLLRSHDDASDGRRVMRVVAWVIPVAWCLFSAAVLATMGEPQALVMLAAPIVAMLAAKTRRSRRVGPGRATC